MSPIETNPTEPTPPTPERIPDMVAFRAEIASLAEERRIGFKEYNEFCKAHESATGKEIDRLWEIEPRKPKNMIELLDVNPNDLTEEDARMWDKVKNYTIGSFTPEELGKYRENVLTTNNPSRQAIFSVIGNKLGPLWTKDYYDQHPRGK